MSSQSEAWQQQFREEFMSENNIINDTMLGNIRMMIYIVYNPKHAGIEYAPADQTLKVIIEFKWYQLWFRRRRTIQRLAVLLYDKFPNLNIEVEEGKYLPNPA